jgi:hypothetical protein
MQNRVQHTIRLKRCAEAHPTIFNFNGGNMKPRRHKHQTSYDPFSAHEALDRSHLLASVFSDFVAGHPFVVANSKLRREAEDLAERLAAFYQVVGQLAFADLDQPETLAVGLRFSKGQIVVEFDDEREVSIPLKRYSTLAKASPSQRTGWKLIGAGRGFYWKSLDLDLSVRGLLAGLPDVIPSPPPLAKGRQRTPRGTRPSS